MTTLMKRTPNSPSPPRRPKVPRIYYSYVEGMNSRSRKLERASHFRIITLHYNKFTLIFLVSASAVLLQMPVIAASLLLISNFSEMPLELWILMFQFCSHREVLKLGCVSRSWSFVCDTVIFHYFSLFRFQDNAVLSKFTHLTSLNLAGNSCINCISRLTNLTKLDISDNALISDLEVLSLTNLTELRMSRNCGVTDQFLEKCTSLTTLCASECTGFTSASFSRLTSLTSCRGPLSIAPALPVLTNLTELYVSPFDDLDLLCVARNNLVFLPKLTATSLPFGSVIKSSLLTNLSNICRLTVEHAHIFPNLDVMTRLTQLNSLSVRHSTITPTSLSLMTNLTELAVESERVQETLTTLTNITKLHVEKGVSISDKILRKLTNLEQLRLAEDCKITDRGVKSLTRLTSLNLVNNISITSHCLGKLTNLTELSLQLNSAVSNDGISNLTRLKKLNIFGNTRLSWHGISKLTNLTAIVGPRETEFPVEYLSALPNLVYLYYVPSESEEIWL